MASTRNIQNELDSLKKEIAALRSDYARPRGRAAAAKVNGMESFATIRDNIAGGIRVIKDRIAHGTGASFVSEHFNEIGDALNDYSAKTERTVAAHPIAAVAGAMTIGYLVGRLVRWTSRPLPKGRPEPIAGQMNRRHSR